MFNAPRVGCSKPAKSADMHVTRCIDGARVKPDTRPMGNGANKHLSSRGLSQTRYTHVPTKEVYNHQESETTLPLLTNPAISLALDVSILSNPSTTPSRSPPGLS